MPAVAAYLNAVRSYGSIPDKETSERHNVSLSHKLTVIDRLIESISQMDLDHYVGWGTLHATNPLFEISNSIFTFKIRDLDGFRFTIAFLVEGFLSQAVSVLDVIGRDIMHAHNLVARGLRTDPNLRQILDKLDVEFPGSSLTSLWRTHYPRGSVSWISTLRNLRNYYVHEDVCGSVLQMGVMIPAKPEILLDKGPFPSNVADRERALSYFCPTVKLQLTQLASDTYSIMTSDINGASRFPL